MSVRTVMVLHWTGCSMRSHGRKAALRTVSLILTLRELKVLLYRKFQVLAEFTFIAQSVPVSLYCSKISLYQVEGFHFWNGGSVLLRGAARSIHLALFALPVSGPS